MQRGPKRQLPTEKRQKGTFQPSRDGHVVELVGPDALPRQPDWLTSGAQEVWLDDVGRVRFATEADSSLFANYCSLQGAIVQAIRKGETPPIAAFTEVRKMQEVLGIGGARSRLGIKSDTKPTNTFSSNGRRG